MTRVIVVGAGAAGLAVAAELGRRGVSCAVLEQADQVGSTWAGRYDSLRLHTVRWLSGLPGRAIPRRSGRWVRRDDLVGYLQDYARALDPEPETGVAVRRIARDPAGWRVETSVGPRIAPVVVVATGLTRTPNALDWPGAAGFTGALVHSSAYREPSAYAGHQVLVVGSGNSAAEIAVELATVADDVLLAVRTPPNIVRRATLGVPSQLVAAALVRLPVPVLNRVFGLIRSTTVPDLRSAGLPAPTGDAFSQFLRSQTVPILDHGFVDAVRAGKISVVAAVDSFDGPEVRLADGSTVRPDAVVAATGFHPDLSGLVGDLGVLDAGGRPLVHGDETHPDSPGLYFVGLTVELGGALRQAGREARAVAAAVTA